MTLAAVQWDLIDAGIKSSIVFSTQTPAIDIMKLGYMWFDYGDYHGELIYIRFAQQIFFAPDTLVTGFGFQLLPGVAGILRPIYSRLQDDPLRILGNVISAKTGQMAGLAETKPNGTMGLPPTITKIGNNTRRLTKR